MCLIRCTKPINMHPSHSANVHCLFLPIVVQYHSTKCGFASVGTLIFASVSSPCTRTLFSCPSPPLVLTGTFSHENIAASLTTHLCPSRDGSHNASMQFVHLALQDPRSSCLPRPLIGQSYTTFIFATHLPCPNSSTLNRTKNSIYVVLTR